MGEFIAGALLALLGWALNLPFGERRTVRHLNDGFALLDRVEADSHQAHGLRRLIERDLEKYLRQRRTPLWTRLSLGAAASLLFFLLLPVVVLWIEPEAKKYFSDVTTVGRAYLFGFGVAVACETVAIAQLLAMTYRDRQIAHGRRNREG